jgi:hypothetical protein
MMEDEGERRGRLCAPLLGALGGGLGRRQSPPFGQERVLACFFLLPNMLLAFVLAEVAASKEFLGCPSRNDQAEQWQGEPTSE